MTTISQLRKTARKIDLIELIDACILETKEHLFNLVRAQLASGQSSEDYLPVYKSDEYSKRKQKLGSKAPYGITDLKLTGNFVDKFYLRVSKNSVIIRSRDKKNSKILEKYGPEIFALNEGNLSKYISEHLQPLLVKKIRNGLLQ